MLIGRRTKIVSVIMVLLGLLEWQGVITITPDAANRLDLILTGLVGFFLASKVDRNSIK